MSLRYLLNHNIPIYASSVVFDKELISKIGLFNEKFFDGLLDFILRASAFNNICYIKDILTNVIKHDGNLTNKVVDFGYYELHSALNSLKESGHISLDEFQYFKDIYRLLNYYYAIQSFIKFKELAKKHLSGFKFSITKIKTVIKLKTIFFFYN